MLNDVSPQLPAFFEFDVVAPSLPGVYSFQWRLLEEGKEWFGRESDNVQVIRQRAAVQGNRQHRWRHQRRSDPRMGVFDGH
jgi:hypothetical protein